MRQSLVVSLICLSSLACSGTGGSTDSGPADAGVDAGQADAGQADAGSMDAGALDAGRDGGAPDAGCGWTQLDAGTTGGCATGSPGPVGELPAMLQLDGGAVIRSNLTYATRGGRVLQGDLFLPPPAAAAPGILVMVHGGGWLDCGQRRGNISGHGLFFSTAMNVGVFNIEYRLIQEGGQYPANLGDVKCAVQFITANAAAYGLDPTKVAIIGESAGGHLALMTALTQDRADLDPGCSATAPRVKAAIAYSAPTDLPALSASTSPAKGAPLVYTQSTCPTPITGCAPSCDRCLDASPRAHACRSPATKILLVHAPDPYDGLLSQSHAVDMAAALTDAGAAVKLVIPTPASVASQNWNGLPCSADAGLAHGFQSPCLLNPTYSELAAAVQQALGP